MACNCPGSGCQCAEASTASISVSGTGSGGNPYKHNAVISATACNQISIVADGLLVPGLTPTTLGVTSGNLLVQHAGCGVDTLVDPPANRVLRGNPAGTVDAAWRPFISTDAGNDAAAGTDGGVFVDVETAVVASGSGFSVGMGIDFYGKLAQVPAGFLGCDGTAITVASGYIALRNFLITAGSPYGTSGADPRLPNHADRSSMGVGSNALGALLGAATVTLTDNESGLKSHFHTASQANHDHAYTAPGANTGNDSGTGWTIQPVAASGTTEVASEHTHTHPQSGTAGISGGASDSSVTVDAVAGASAVSAHNNIHPVIVVNKIIKY